jgi:hypothetical protein
MQELGGYPVHGLGYLGARLVIEPAAEPGRRARVDLAGLGAA